jgi:TonB dependent receptor
LNGTFGFGRNDLPFDPSNPRTYPDRLTIRVPGSSSSLVKANYYSAFAQDKWRMTDRLTASIGLRYDLEVIPTPGADQPELGVVGSYPVDKNNVAPRIGFSYDLHGTGRTVVRGGYGIFYDKTHFDLGITGLYTAGVFSNSFTVNFPTNNADPGPREGRLPTDPMLVNGPVINRDLLNQRYPPGASVKNTGTVSLDNPDRVVPMNHQATIGFEKQLASDLAFNVDYVHVWGRDFFMTKDLNAGLRAQPVPTSPIIRAHRDLFTAAVNQLVNVGETDYDALQMQFEKRFSRNYSARVSYTLAYARGNTANTGSPTSGFQVLDDMRLELNEGPTNLDRRHNLAVSGTAQVPRTGGLTVSWIARALSGSPFTLTNSNVDPDRNGSQTEPLPSGTYRGVAPTPADEPDVYEVDFESKRNGAYGPGFFQVDMRVGYRLRPRGDMTLDVYGEVYNLTNTVNFGNPGGNQAAPTTFLILNNYRDGAVPRTGQFGVRFAF